MKKTKAKPAKKTVKVSKPAKVVKKIAKAAKVLTGRVTPMMDLLKKAALVGLGAAVFTKEKAESVVQDLVKKGDLTQDDSKKFFQELLVKGEQSKLDLEKLVDQQAQRLLNKAQLAKKSDVEDLKKQIQTLSRKLETLSQNPGKM